MLATTYDDLERIGGITDVTVPSNPETIVGYEYVGRARVARRSYGNGTRLEYAYDGITGAPNPPNDFGERRVVGTRHVFDPGSTNEVILDDRSYTWDRMDNKTKRSDVRAGGPQLTHAYTYDSIYRLTNVTVTDVSAMVLRNEDYVLDDVGNRSSRRGKAGGG